MEFVNVTQTLGPSLRRPCARVSSGQELLGMYSIQLNPTDTSEIINQKRPLATNKLNSPPHGLYNIGALASSVYCQQHKATSSICLSSCRILHKVDGSKDNIHYHFEDILEIFLAKHTMPLWSRYRSPSTTTNNLTTKSLGVSACLSEPNSTLPSCTTPNQTGLSRANGKVFTAIKKRLLNPKSSKDLTLQSPQLQVIHLSSSCAVQRH